MTNEEVIKYLGFLKQDESFFYPNHDNLGLMLKQSKDIFGKIKLKLSYNLNYNYKEETRKIYNNINYFKHYLCEKLHELKSLNYLELNSWNNQSEILEKQHLIKYHYLKKFSNMQIDIVFYGLDQINNNSESNLGLKFNIYFRKENKIIWKTTIPKSFDLLKIVSNPNNYAFEKKELLNFNLQDLILIGFKKETIIDRNLYESINISNENKYNYENYKEDFLIKEIKTKKESYFTYKTMISSSINHQSILINAYDCTYNIEGLQEHCYKTFFNEFDNFILNVL